MYGGSRKRPLSPRISYDSDDAADIVETPVIYGAGSSNMSSRVELFRLDLAPRKIPQLGSSDRDDDEPLLPRSGPLLLEYSQSKRDEDRGDCDCLVRHGTGLESRNFLRGHQREGLRRQHKPQESGTPEEHRQLVELIAHYLMSIQINPYNGSVPVERIQNVMRDKHASLYAKVVGSGKNAWGKFLERHSNVFRIVADAEKKRICLRSQQNWEEGDQLEMQERLEREEHLVKCLFQFFDIRGTSSCKVDEFMDAYAQLPMNTSRPKAPELPARGDFVRFVKRHSYNFTYNSKELEISLRSTLWPPPKDHQS